MWEMETNKIKIEIKKKNCVRKIGSDIVILFPFNMFCVSHMISKRCSQTCVEQANELYMKYVLYIKILLKSCIDAMCY